MHELLSSRVFVGELGAVDHCCVPCRLASMQLPCWERREIGRRDEMRQRGGERHGDRERVKESDGGEREGKEEKGN